MNIYERAAAMQNGYHEALAPLVAMKVDLLNCFPTPLRFVGTVLQPPPPDYAWMPPFAREMMKNLDEAMNALARCYTTMPEPDPIDALGAAIRQRATKEAYPSWPEPVKLREDHWPFKLTNDSPP